LLFGNAHANPLRKGKLMVYLIKHTLSDMFKQLTGFLHLDATNGVNRFVIDGPREVIRHSSPIRLRHDFDIDNEMVPNFSLFFVKAMVGIKAHPLKGNFCHNLLNLT